MFEGTYTALVTPFKNGKVDYPSFEKLIERQIEGKVQGVIPAGCTGEAATMSPQEQLELIQFTVEQVKGRVQIIAGTGSNSTREAVEMSEKASKLDIQGVLVITPYYNKPTPSGILSHYYGVADASKVPVMVYNVPGRTGTKISAETIAELAKHPNISSVKEACGSVDQVCDIVSQCDVNVLSGDDGLTLPMMSVGAKGVVSVSANVMPAEVSAMVKCALEGDFAAAKIAHYELLSFHKSMFAETNPIPVKTVLGEMGLVTKELRLPLEYGKESTVELAHKLIADYNLKA
ncbi:MAG: 4-hydroxy-tetrahydrodipicolinate synthase [Planctomycetes bacterium]|nr:4-hydroxy-tetrahydrodipicolinate synthase [Planctomycetota bacterium]